MIRQILRSWLIVMIGAAVGGLLAIAWFLNQKPVEPSPLKPGEAVRIEIDGRTLKVTTPEGTKREFVPDTAKVTVQDGGKVDVEVQKIGFKSELGGGFAVTPDRLKLELDTRIAYAWRLSLHGGMTLDPSAEKIIDVARPLLFIAYPLSFKWTPNSSVWIGRELPGEWCGGLRVRF